MTKLTNEELLYRYDFLWARDGFSAKEAAEVRELRVEILQRMAEGAAGEASAQAGYRFNPSEQHIVDEAAKDGASLCEILCNYSYCITQLNKWNVRKFDRSGERLSLYGRMMELHEPDPGSASTAGPRPVSPATYVPQCINCIETASVLDLIAQKATPEAMRTAIVSVSTGIRASINGTIGADESEFAAAPAEGAEEK